MLHVETAEQAAQIERYLLETWQRVAGKTEEYPSHRTLQEYNERLPKLYNKSLVEHIEERVASGPKAITVLDVGCGQGLCLAQLARDYPQVRAVGITAADFRREAPTPWQPLIQRVDYRLEDAHKLTEIAGDINPDFVISLHAFEYFVDPLSVLQQAYDLCADNAIIFIDHAKMFLTSDEANQLENIWKEHGINTNLERWSPHTDVCSLYSLAIQKRSGTKLPLPFRYSFADLGSRTRGYIFDSTQ